MAASDTVTTLYLTRHGVSEHNLRNDVYMGRAPQARLLPEGAEQARRLARRLARGAAVQRIVCSSLPRTVATGLAIAEVLGLPGVEREDAFWDLSKGDWEGAMAVDNVPPEAARALAADPYGFRYPNGESFRDVAARVWPAFQAWVARSEGQTVLFVLHGDVLLTVLHQVLRYAPEKIADLATEHCSLTELRVRAGRYQLVCFNDASHLHPG